MSHEKTNHAASRRISTRPQAAPKGAIDVRNVFEAFCDRAITTDMACEALGIGRTRFYELRTECLRVRAAGNAGTWVPGLSGGNHKGDWKPEVGSFLHSALACRYPYAFAASEVLRKFGVTLHRSQVPLRSLSR